MTADQQLARAVLTAAAVYDHRFREPDPNVAAAWARALAGLDPQRAVDAVNEHYRTSTETLLPGHVTGLVHRVGGAPDRSPAARSVAEALASTLGGRADSLAADRDDPTPAIEGPAPRSGAEALAVAADWARARPTGYEGRRGTPTGRAAEDTSKRLGREQRDRGARTVDGRTDTQRADAGRAFAICFDCAGDIPAPAGWDPTDPGSPPLFCGRCRPAEAREAS